MALNMISVKGPINKTSYKCRLVSRPASPKGKTEPPAGLLQTNGGTEEKLTVDNIFHHYPQYKDMRWYVVFLYPRST